MLIRRQRRKDGYVITGGYYSMKDRSKGIIKLILSVIVIAAAVFVAVFGIGKNSAMSAKDIKLGLDLAGGVSITYQAVKDSPSDTEMSDTVYKMQKGIAGLDHHGRKGIRENQYRTGRPRQTAGRIP